MTEKSRDGSPEPEEEYTIQDARRDLYIKDLGTWRSSSPLYARDYAEHERQELKGSAAAETRKSFSGVLEEVLQKHTESMPEEKRAAVQAAAKNLLQILNSD